MCSDLVEELFHLSFVRLLNYSYFKTLLTLFSLKFRISNETNHDLSMNSSNGSFSDRI